MRRILCFLVIMGCGFAESSTEWRVGNGEWFESLNWSNGIPNLHKSADIYIGASTFPGYTVKKLITISRSFAKVDKLHLFFQKDFYRKGQQFTLSNPTGTLLANELRMDSDNFWNGRADCLLNVNVEADNNFIISSGSSFWGIKDTHPTIEKNLTVTGDLGVYDNQTLTVDGNATIGTSSEGGNVTASGSRIYFRGMTEVFGTMTIENATIGKFSYSGGAFFSPFGSVEETATLRDIKINSGEVQIGNNFTVHSKKVFIESNGKLVVDGQMLANGNINNKGSINGTGRIHLSGHKLIGNPASIVKGGSSPIGKLIIDGEVDLQNGAILEVEADGSTMSQLEISNLVVGEGAHVDLIMDRPSSPEAWLQFLEHGETGNFLQVGQLTGTLPAFEVNYPGFSATTVQNGNNFSVDIEPLPLASLVSNSNEKKVAHVFDIDHASESLDFIHVNSELYFLQLPQLKEALDQLHPALFNNVALAQEETTAYITKVLSQRLEEITWKNPNKKDRNWDVWGQGIRDYARQKGKHTLPGYTATTPGIIAGADVKIDNQFALGFHGAYTNTHLSWEKGAAHGHTTTGYGGLYGSWYTEHYLVGLSLLGGWNSSKATRSILFGEVNRNAHHRVHGWEIAPQLELGGLWEWDYISLEPFIKENYVYLHQNHYRETGAESLDLSVQSKHSDVLRSEVGFGLFHSFAGKELQFTPEVKLSYIYESRFQGKDTTAYFLNGTVEPFTVKGLSPSRSLGHVGAFLKGSSYNGFDLTLDYNFLFGKEYRDHKMALRLDYAF